MGLGVMGPDLQVYPASPLLGDVSTVFFFHLHFLYTTALPPGLVLAVIRLRYYGQNGHSHSTFFVCCLFVAYTRMASVAQIASADGDNFLSHASKHDDRAGVGCMFFFYVV